MCFFFSFKWKYTLCKAGYLLCNLHCARSLALRVRNAIIALQSGLHFGFIHFSCCPVHRYSYLFSFILLFFFSFFLLFFIEMDSSVAHRRIIIMDMVCSRHGSPVINELITPALLIPHLSLFFVFNHRAEFSFNWWSLGVNEKKWVNGAHYGS